MPGTPSCLARPAAVQRLGSGPVPVTRRDRRAHPAKAGQTRTAHIERHGKQRHAAGHGNPGKGRPENIGADLPRDGDIIAQQQVDLVRRQAAAKTASR